MKKITKLVALILMAILFIGFTGCKEKNLEKVTVVLPSGAPLMAIGDLLDNEAFEFTVVNGADPLSAALISGEYDMVIAPLNLGAKLYTTGKTSYKLDSIITSNNTYIVSRNEFTVEDLNGKNILAYGKNSTPDIVLKAALESKGLTSNISYQTSVADAMSLFLAGDEASEFTLTAEPQATMIKNKVAGVTVIDLLSVFDGKVFPQACLYVKADKDYSDHLKLIEKNIKALNNKPADYAKSVVSKHTYFETLGEAVLTEALPKCNIVYLKAKDNKTAVNDYVNYLNQYANAVLGGKTVDDGFYN